jgi:uncharacterized protein (DUF58 family)
VRTLVPRRRLLAALAGGAGLVALAQLSPAFWVVAAIYHGVLLVLLGGDLARLPGPGAFAAERQVPRPLSLGAEQQVVVIVRGAGAAGLEARLADHVPADLRPSERELPARFDGQGVLRAAYSVRPPHRGAFALGPLDLRTWRHGGWWIRQVRVPARETARVYPDVLAVRRYQLTLRRGMPFRPGLRRSRPPGATTSFAGLRDYMPGDDFRRINWKATARSDRPVTNELEAERGQQLLLVLECGRLMTAPAGDLSKLDHAVNAALLLAWTAQRHGDRVGLVTFTDEVHAYVPPGGGPAQMTRLNDALYAVRPEYVEPDFGAPLRFLAGRVTRRSLVVLLTDVLDAGASRDLLTQALWMARRHLVMVVAMADPALLAVQRAPVRTAAGAYEWAAAEELLASRRHTFDALQRGGVLGLDVEAGKLSPALVERYLEIKERALL